MSPVEPPPEKIGPAGRLLIIAAASALTVLFLIAVSPIVKAVLIAALLAYILNPLVVFLESRDMGRTAATTIVFLVLGGLIFWLMTVLLPVIISEIGSFRASIAAGQGSTIVERFGTYINDRLTAIGAERIDLMEMWHRFVLDKVNRAQEYILNAVWLLTYLLLIPFVTYFLLTDGRSFKRGFVRMVPNRYFEFTLNLLYQMDYLLGNYLRGLLIEAIIISMMSVAVLWVLGLKYFVLLGIIAGLTTIIPYFGPVVGSLPAIAVALIDTGETSYAIAVATSLVTVHVIDNVAVKPLVISKMVDLHPITVLLVVVIGGMFFGVLGMLLSVPFTAIVKVGAFEFVKNLRRYFRGPYQATPCGQGSGAATE